MDGWKIKTGNYISKYTEADDCIALATDRKEEKRVIRARKKRKYALNVKKKGITLMNVTKNSQTRGRW